MRAEQIFDLQIRSHKFKHSATRTRKKWVLLFVGEKQRRIHSSATPLDCSAFQNLTDRATGAQLDPGIISDGEPGCSEEIGAVLRESSLKSKVKVKGNFSLPGVFFIPLYF